MCMSLRYVGPISILEISMFLQTSMRRESGSVYLRDSHLV